MPVIINWLKRFEAWPKQVVVLACIVFTTMVGLVDYVTGYETFFFTFYLLAIFLGTWRVNAAFGAWLSALSVTAWVSSNIEAGAHYSNYFVPVWNAAIMFTIYLIIVFLLSRLKKINEELEERVRLRTEALTREIQERMRLQKELLETSEREQRRIGRDLHDGLCQQLTGTALTGHLLAQKLTDKALDEAGEAARLVDLLEETIEMTRNLSHELNPVELQTGKLTDHFEKLAADTVQRFKVECRFEGSLSHPLDDATVGTHLYRIAQEAVVHAAKHGRAGRINIGLDSAEDEIVLTITDDGAVAPEKRDSDTQGHLGPLRALAYRADLIGASLNIERLATRGTRVTCVLPLTGTTHGTKN
ncbi:MAG TPA: sensor histidine kinase [Candidatus Cybelea sp.]|nr:sensor histidine kinase [Candidatus Cybelea sp.]